MWDQDSKMFILLSWKTARIESSQNLFIWCLRSSSQLFVSLYVYIQGVGWSKRKFSFPIHSGPIGRIILAQISPTYLHLDIFGESIDFLKGASLPSIFIGWFDVEQVRSARIVMANAFPNRIEDGTGGVLNTLYAAEAYANFGYFGIIIGTIYIGILIQVLYIVFIRLPKNPIFLCLFVYFSINIPRTLVGGFADFIFNPIWIFITLLLIGMMLFIKLQIEITAYLKNRKLKSQL